MTHDRIVELSEIGNRECYAHQEIEILIKETLKNKEQDAKVKLNQTIINLSEQLSKNKRRLSRYNHLRNLEQQINVYLNSKESFLELDWNSPFMIEFNPIFGYKRDDDPVNFVKYFLIVAGILGIASIVPAFVMQTISFYLLGFISIAAYIALNCLILAAVYSIPAFIMRSLRALNCLILDCQDSVDEIKSCGALNEKLNQAFNLPMMTNKTLKEKLDRYLQLVIFSYENDHDNGLLLPSLQKIIQSLEMNNLDDSIKNCISPTNAPKGSKFHQAEMNFNIEIFKHIYQNGDDKNKILDALLDSSLPAKDMLDYLVRYRAIENSSDRGLFIFTSKPKKLEQLFEEITQKKILLTSTPSNISHHHRLS